MDKFETLIGQALSEEDRELLRSHGEPGYFSQAFALFRGRLGWVVWLAYVTSIVAFVGFVYALWQVWTGSDLLATVRWGVVTIVLFHYAAMMKAFLGNHLEANRILREVKRVELQLALLREGRMP